MRKSKISMPSGYADVIQLPVKEAENVSKVREMLKQVEVWINSGDDNLAEKHWDLIAEECKKYGTGLNR